MDHVIRKLSLKIIFLSLFIVRYYLNGEAIPRMRERVQFAPKIIRIGVHETCSILPRITFHTSSSTKSIGYCHAISQYRDFEKVVGGPLIHTDFVQSFRLMRFGVKRFFKFTYTIFFALIETLERSMKYSAMPNLHVFFIDLNLVALKFSEFT